MCACLLRRPGGQAAGRQTLWRASGSGGRAAAEASAAQTRAVRAAARPRSLTQPTGRRRRDGRRAASRCAAATGADGKPSRARCCPPAARARTSIIAIIGSGPAACLAATICATTSGWSIRSEHSFSAARACSSVSVGDCPPGGTIGNMAAPAPARTAARAAVTRHRDATTDNRTAHENASGAR